MKENNNVYIKTIIMRGGKAVLKIYNPPVPDTVNGDVLKYASYTSTFDHSYKIVSINGVLMIFVEDDKYPIVIKEEETKDLINDCEKTRKLVYNTFMNRYR